MYRPVFFLFFVIFWQTNIYSQETWTLERCIQEAIANNIQIQQTDLAVRRDEIGVTTARAGRFPSLNASTSFYESFGRQIDPTTNSFNSQNFGNQSYNLNSGITLFNFNYINNTIRQNVENLKASKADKSQMERDIALNVAQAYLVILVAKENLEVSRKSLEQTNEQLTMTDKLIAAGSKNRNARLELLAQQANNEAQIITAENDVTIGFLNLKQLMNIAPDLSMDIAPPAIGLPMENPEEIDYQALISYSIKSQPKFEALEYKLRSALLGEKIARAQGLPSIQAQASAGTSYSTLSQRILSTTLERQQIPGVLLNDEPVSLSFLNPTVTTGKNPYFNQLNQNLGFGLGVGLSIPIYNRNQVKASVQNARLNTENVRLQDSQAKQQLLSDILRALTDAQAARRNLDAANKNYDALNGAYNDTQKRFEIGAANTFELVSAKNNLDNAHRNTIIRKYDYIFKMKVLDYYAGRQIILE